MQPTTLLALAVLATSALAALDSSPHGAGAVGLPHRRHHAKAAARSSKCKSKNQGTTSSSSSTSTSSTPAWVAPTTTSSSDPAPSPSDSSSDGSSDNSSSGSSNGGSSNVASTPNNEQSGALAGITAFLGTNTGNIGSWFRTDSSSDDTNGQSWCWLPYQDTWMGTAIPVGTMIDSFGGDEQAAQMHYCGLEIQATDPSNGNTVTMYVVDGFDMTWVKSPGAMDMTIAAFTALYGSFDDNKDTVVENMSWEFTGNRNPAYQFNQGNPA